MQNQSTNTGWIWFVGIISIVALVLAWMAYNRAGENLSTQVEQVGDELAMEAEQATNQLGSAVEQNTDQVVSSTEAALARAEARAELLALEAELEVEANYQAAVAQVEQVRLDLRNTYQNAEGEVRAQWQEVDQELSDLESSLRTESADALEVLGGLILMLEADVRTDEQ